MEPRGGKRPHRPESTRPTGVAAGPWRGGGRSLGGRPRGRYTVRFAFWSATLIEALLDDDLVESHGGRFKLTALIQRRLAEIIMGARPLVERNTADGRHLSNLELVVEEIRQGKITIDWEASGLKPPTPSRKR